MKFLKYLVASALLISLTSCSKSPIVVGNINTENKNSFTIVSADTSNIVITKLNGVLIDDGTVLGRLNPGKYLVKPGRTIVEAYFLGYKNQKITSCFIFNAGHQYEVRPNFSRSSAPMVASIADNLIYGKNAPNCY